MVTDVIRRRHDWPGATCERVVYCTARVDGRTDPEAHRDQDVYLKALVAHGAVDHIEYGAFVARARTAPLATIDDKGRPVVTRSRWPIMVKDADGADVPNAVFVAQVLNVEEKGSDWGHRPAEGWGTTSRRACCSTSCAGTSTRRSSSRTTATCGCRCTRRGRSCPWAS
jgi:hypothetical protein